MSKKGVRIVAAFLVIMMMAGCGDERILERLGFIESQSFDLLPNGKLRITCSIPIADPQSEQNRKVIAIDAESSKDAKLEFNKKTSLTLVSGQLRNLLISKSVAEQGLWDKFDTFGRDPAISPQVNISIVNGNAGHLLEKDYKQHPPTDKYVNRLLGKEARAHTIPKMTLYEFSRDLLDDGIDSIAPIIKEEEDNITLDGIGLFMESKYVTKIDTEEAIILGFLRGNLQRSAIDVELKKGQQVMFNSLTSKRKVKVEHADTERAKVAIHVHLKGSILEYTGPLKLDNPSNRREIAKTVSEHLTERANKMVKFMQKHQVDSLGIGQYVRNSLSHNEWQSMNWRDVYSKADIECYVHIKIRNIGKSS